MPKLKTLDELFASATDDELESLKTSLDSNPYYTQFHANLIRYTDLVRDIPTQKTPTK